MFEVKLRNPDDFLKVKETLTRIGVTSKDSQRLYQSCHILHKRGCYYIVHFKEMFVLDGKESTMSEQDAARKNRIIKLLVEWQLVDLMEGSVLPTPICPMNAVRVVSFKDKNNWELIPKYEIGG